MLTLVGVDRLGIVARVTRAIFEAGGSLGEASMIRLGGNFTIMMMVATDEHPAKLERAMSLAASELGLRFHMDPLEGGLHRHRVPNVQVRVTGADRSGIVARVTGTLADAGFDILALESDVAGDEERPVYIMNIQGYSDRTIESLRAATAILAQEGIAVDIGSIETLIG
ncbi:MAG: Glycine cleavage system transcriptional antiactivator GcvR [Olavius algarvensis Gamma 1 endosymbiont]|nr:MAG: Glycine cleavage system transcriptional antiactivator GcvR [Olavius algarvensis Gamma 1 endosymbiont]